MYPQHIVLIRMVAIVTQRDISNLQAVYDMSAGVKATGSADPQPASKNNR